ncbi:aldehyde dehydrogenase (NAD(P)(+)) ald5, partial [Penicillium waksmanii]|uniref:aldehyde dehydrogenase (NAD(P)(+)) ald5 n=1 Tax=Penicillium waksmanii TaxID=69791 RepID=UPI00254842AB
MKAATSSNLEATLEPGGKSPTSEYLGSFEKTIIFPDAYIDAADKWYARDINMNFGQTCHAGTRFCVHKDVYGEFLAKFTQHIKSITVGHPFNKAADHGPPNNDAREEVFGLGVANSEFSLDGEVNKQANSRTYGLAVACHTKGYERGHS